MCIFSRWSTYNEIQIDEKARLSSAPISFFFFDLTSRESDPRRGIQKNLSFLKTRRGLDLIMTSFPSLLAKSLHALQIVRKIDSSCLRQEEGGESAKERAEAKDKEGEDWGELGKVDNHRGEEDGDAPSHLTQRQLQK